MDVYPAELVMALNGRDKGKYFMVAEVIDAEYILICDGKSRPCEKPKKKKLKHVKRLDCTLDRIKEKMELNKKISNSDIRKAIKSALADLEIF